MCTRFFIEKENPELIELMEAVSHSFLVGQFMEKLAKPLHTFGEIRPTDVVPVIAPDKNGSRAVFPMKWGFTLSGKRAPLVNARVETAAVKPTFKAAWAIHRCIVPASWYYEWEHFTASNGKRKTGDKYMIQPVGSTVTWLCGLYRFENGLPVFTVLTREPTGELAQLHDRMPLMLSGDKIIEWIRPDAKPEDMLLYALTDMVIEKAGDEHIPSAVHMTND